MKILSLLCMLCFMILSVCAQELDVQVTNPASFDRPVETIELKWSDVQNAIHPADPATVAVFDGAQQLVSQTIDVNGDGTPELLLFQSSFKSQEQKNFVVRKGDAQQPKRIAVADFMVPRLDVAWENDRIAYRIYGGPIAGDVRCGIDVLVKRVHYPVLAGWYAGDSLKGKARISYHVDHGEGADFYDVGKTLGGGGCALWEKDTMIQSGLFTSHAIIASGPIRAMFRVAYEKDTLNGKPFTETRLFSLDAGDNLNKIDVSFSGLQDSAPEMVAIGLEKRKNVTFSSDEQQGWFSLYGPTGKDSASGDIATGVVIPGTSYKTTKEVADHYLMLSQTGTDNHLVYYAGGGWNRSGDFPDEQSWKNCLALFSQRLKYPLHVTVTSK